ncbi:hypothetical protein PACTADRAFT_57500 [Pachysolen tannophilus NRRL Y-2460]|uniref:Uncharacterized protein n=1 Tax=Pachysolen tannophilus NRRL Y-2460 TaxID=669874 RepID=A0A1E4TXI5_PACTA|nr:hypothetical protein PACTADRAFT_57500 [Pachysolen tannophilus NRRL Y-2460]
MSSEVGVTALLDERLDEKLKGIRLQINSKLDNQKQLALILSVVDDNIQEQKNKKTTITYLLSFLALLEQSINNENINFQLLTSVTYFLDLLLPFTPRQLLKSKYSDILTRIAPVITNENADAPLLKSTIGCLETLLLAQDYTSWVNTDSFNISPKRGLMGLLEISLDIRPKVRKRAQEAVGKILSNPPASPSSEHVCSNMCADFALKSIIKLLSQKQNNKKQDIKDLNSKIIHNLQLINTITMAGSWPQQKIESLCDLLLEISKTNDQFLVSSSFNCFESLFQSMTNELENDKFLKVLDIIFDLKPSIDDSNLSASWLAVIAKAVIAYSKIEPLNCLAKIPKILNVLKDFFKSEIKNINISVSQCFIALISDGINDNYLLLPPKVKTEIYEQVDDIITEISKIFNNDLLSFQYSHCFKEILEVLVVIFKKFQNRANPDFIKSLEIVGEWRSNESSNFEYREEAENVIGAAISGLGPDTVLSTIPLNLDKTIGGRAWLLPLLRDNISNSELSIFKKQFIPLLKFYEERISNTPEKNTVILKIFETIVQQIWSLLPKFCYIPKDLEKSFDNEFCSFLADNLYSDTSLRVVICHALKNVVESNLNYVNGLEHLNDVIFQQQFPMAKAENSIKYLKTQASNILSVLMNVFTSTQPEQRGYIIETIDVYLQIISKEELEENFNKLCGHLNNALIQESNKETSNNNANNKQQQKSDTSKLSVTLMDLIVTMAKYLPESSYVPLFGVFNTTVSNKDALIQKRAYRIISKLSESEEGKNAILKYISNIEEILIQSADTCLSSSKASRLSCILTIVRLMPLTDLYLIPCLISEIILSTKDVNEKTRNLSYEVIIAMAYKMSEEGGIIDNSKIPGLESLPPANSSLQKFFEICSPGLAGSTPHMISATITCFSCLFYEFHSKMDDEHLLEMYKLIELFLTQKNREIVKSAIGFVKVAILSLPEQMIVDNIKDLLSKLMVWSHEHKGHFKSKVKHIIERMIRRFGIELIEENIPEDDKKLVINIKKSKLRAKRKKLESKDSEEISGTTNGKKSNNFASAYEEALYDSDSEEEGEEEEIPEDGTRSNKRKSKQYILESKDVPLDLLDRQQLSQISSSKPKKFTKQDLVSKANIKTSTNGKFIIKESGTEKDPLANQTSGINAYLEALENGPIRGQKGKLKYKKNSRAGNDNDDDNAQDSDEDSKPNLPRKNFTKGNKIGKPQHRQKFKARKKL